MTELNSGWAQFNDLRRDAAQQYPDDLKRQNVFIRQQLTMLKELETVGSRDRMNKLRDERAFASGTMAKRDVDNQIRREARQHIESGATSTEAKAHQLQWALDQGLGDPSGGRDFISDLTGAGIRGGGSGMLQTGLGAATSTLKAKMSGLGTGGKLALGLTAGAVIGGVAFAVTQLKQGWDLYKTLAPELLNIAALTGKLPEDAEAFRDAFLGVAKSTATASAELAQYEKQWMGIIGTRAGGGTMASILDVSQAFGINKGVGIEFAAQMGMTGYRAGGGDEMLKKAIADGTASGIGIARLPEYLQGLQQITSAVMRTSVTVDPALMSSYARDLGALGVPFQGARGASVLGGIQQGMQGGIGFQAARRILGPGAGLFDIKALQEQGLNDPRMLEEFIAIFGEMANIGGKTGADLVSARKRQAFMMSKATGLPLLNIFNPDEAINSLLEMTGGFKPSDIDFQQKVRDYKSTFAFESQQAGVAADIARINTAAFLFETSVRSFYESVNILAEYTLALDVEATPVIYDATNRRGFGMSESTSGSRAKGSVRSKYK